MCKVMNVREVAKELGIAQATVRKLIREGEIPSFRPSPRRIVIPVTSFDEWLRRKAETDHA